MTGETRVPPSPHAPTSRRRWLLAAAAVLVMLVVGGTAVWRAGLLDKDHPEVPGCVELAKTLPAATGGTWGVTNPDPSRRLTTSSTSCELAFTSADQSVSGRVTVLIVGDTDSEVLRREVRDAPCNSAPRALDPSTSGYLALKTCQETIGGVARATVLAARKPRWVHMVATVPIPEQNPRAASEVARTVARVVADHALTVSAGD